MMGILLSSRNYKSLYLLYDENDFYDLSYNQIFRKFVESNELKTFENIHLSDNFKKIINQNDIDFVQKNVTQKCIKLFKK